MTDPIKAKIQALCPDVMELKFGCEIVWQGKNWRNGSSFPPKRGIVLGRYQKYGRAFYATLIDGERTNTEFRAEEFKEILGSRITLAVVLRAIEKALSDIGEGWYAVDVHGRFFAGGEDGTDLDTKASWNLAKDRWEDQDEPMRKLVGSLLGV